MVKLGAILLDNIESFDEINENAWVFWVIDPKESPKKVTALIWDKKGIKSTSLSLSAEEYEEERQKRLLINKEDATVAILGKKTSGNFFLSEIFEMNNGILETVENDFRAMVFRKQFPEYEIQASGYIVIPKEGNLARQRKRC